MTTLLPPLTVIAPPASDLPSSSSSASDGSRATERHATSTGSTAASTAARPGDGTAVGESRPPLATWYDESNRLFVGLFFDDDTTTIASTSSSTSISASAAASSAAAAAAVVVRFQTYSIPGSTSSRRIRMGNNTSSGAGSTCGTAAAAGSSNANIGKGPVIDDSLITGGPIRVVLPDELVRGSSSSSSGENDMESLAQEDNTEEAIQIIMAKLSLDRNYMALQLSSTLVRVVRIIDGDVNDKEHVQQECEEGQQQADDYGQGERQRQAQDVNRSGHSGEVLTATEATTTTAAASTSTSTSMPVISKYQRQWTIDLSHSLEPMISDPHVMPRTTKKSEFPFAAGGQGGAGAVAGAAVYHHARRLLRNRQLPGLGDIAGGEAAKNSILPGGVIWIDRPSDTHPVLVLINTHSVVLYKIHPTRHAMQKVETHSYPSSMPVSAASFWYESETRTLAVGKYVRHNEDGVTSNAVKLELSVYLFDELIGGQKASSNIATVIAPFVLGQERLSYTTTSSGDGGNDNDGSITFDDVALVSAYGDPYLVELRVGNKQGGVNIFKVDRMQKRITTAMKLDHPSEFPVMGDASSLMVAAVDNVIILVNRKSMSSVFVDVAQVEGEDEHEPYYYMLPAGDDEDECRRILSDNEMSFLPPNYLLDPRDRGSLHEISFDLEELIQSAPPSSFTVPFILRRRIDPVLSHQLALECINNILIAEDWDLSMLCKWIEHVGETYAQGGPEVAKWDHEACLPLIPAAALLSTDGDSNTLMLQDDNPSLYLGMLFQTEVIQIVLLPQAKEAIGNADKERLNLICDVCLKYMSSLEATTASATPALECLTIALLWRLGQAEEAMSILSARREWQKVLASKHNAMRDGTPPYGAFMVIGNESLAEMIIAITTQVEYAAPSKELFATSAMTHSVDILTSVASYHVAAKHLLAAGRVVDAITICQKAILPAKSAAALRQQQQTEEQTLTRVPALGVRAYDFFFAAVERAKLMPSVGERARLLLYVHSFITDYDRESMVISIGEDELQSALAKQYGEFPSELLHGNDAPVCISLKACFGFPVAQVVR